MGETNRRGTDVTRRLNGPSGDNPTVEDATEEVLAEEAGGDGAGAEVADPVELRSRLEAKDRHIRELYDEVAAARLAIDEARARVEASKLREGDLEKDRSGLKDRLRVLEEEGRTRRRRREGQDRRAARLEREIERREGEIRRLEDLLEERKNKMEAYSEEVQAMAARKDAALEEALRRVEGLEHDLEDRENEANELKITIDELQAELDLEYELRRHMAEPANRLRAGIELFNDSEPHGEVVSISKSLGQPEVHVALGEGDEEPPVILTFTWPDLTWRTYFANPGLAVEEPLVYLQSASEDPSPGVAPEPSNAHLGPDGRVVLGL